MRGEEEVGGEAESSSGQMRSSRKRGACVCPFVFGKCTFSSHELLHQAKRSCFLCVGKTERM